MFKKSMVFLVLVFMGAGSGVVWAKESPESVLKESVDDIIMILNEPSYQDSRVDPRKQRLFDKASEIFDFRSLSMGALGKSWTRFNEAQKTEFVDLFARLIAESYFARMEGQNFEDVAIVYKEAEMLASTGSGIKRADVATILIHNGVKTPVVYRMLEKEGAWKVYDVIIEGVSMVSNYREQYRKRFMDSPDLMIRELKEKL